MTNRQMLDILENASRMLEKVISYNEIINDYVSRDISEVEDAKMALNMLTHNREHYQTLLNESFKLTDDAANEIEKVILKLNEIEEVSSVN